MLGLFVIAHTWASTPESAKHTSPARNPSPERLPTLETVKPASEKQQQIEEKPLEIISSQDFNNKYIVIDGKHFVGCTFRNCVVEHNGEHYQMTSCNMQHGSIKFVTKNRAIIE